MFYDQRSYFMREEKNQREYIDRLYDAASKLLRAADVNGMRLFEFDSEEGHHNYSKKKKVSLAN